MPVDGSFGRLNAHNERIKDLRRRKEQKGENNTIIRSKKDDKIDFDSIDPIQLKKNKRRN